jgi:hypothetical protein
MCFTPCGLSANASANGDSAGVSGAKVSTLNAATTVAIATTDIAGFYYFATTGILAAGISYTIERTSLAGFSTWTPAFQTFIWQGTGSTFNFSLN